MALIRPISDIAEKWQRVTPQRADDYKKGVESPLRDWEKNASAAEGAWEEGVQQAAADKRFGKGVKKAGTGKWQRKARDLGVPRWPQGIRVARPDYEAGFAPFRDEIEKTVLPPKGPKGDPRNYDRVRAIADALHKKKLSLLG